LAPQRQRKRVDRKDSLQKPPQARSLKAVSFFDIVAGLIHQMQCARPKGRSSKPDRTGSGRMFDRLYRIAVISRGIPLIIDAQRGLSNHRPKLIVDVAVQNPMTQAAKLRLRGRLRGFSTSGWNWLMKGSACRRKNLKT